MPLQMPALGLPKLGVSSFCRSLSPHPRGPLPGFTGNSVCRRKGDVGRSCFSDAGLENIVGWVYDLCTWGAGTHGGRSHHWPALTAPLASSWALPTAGTAHSASGTGSSSGRGLEDRVRKHTLKWLLWKSNESTPPPLSGFL